MKFRNTHCKHGHEFTEENTRVYKTITGVTQRCCRICQSKASVAYKLNHPSYSDHQKEIARNLKLKVLTYYGPAGLLGCCWIGCTVVDLDMLSLDHIDDDGAKHRKELAGSSVYRDVLKRNFPSGFQTLCHNHQWKKRITGRVN